MAMSWIKKAVRTTVMVIANLSVAIQPVLAQSIVPDTGPNAPTVLRTSNGVDMVQIERPNSAGVSHNTYDQFNVATSGAILNNINTNYGVTNLGGFVQGNPNLSRGTASLIINEVTSTKPSELLGYLEVGGARADVIVANANGITCNGCGFINTDHAALTTGGLTFASDGTLDTINVTQGLIEIGERGADARGVSQFDLIARQVNFAGTVQGQRVLVIAGQNDVIFATGDATATSDGSDSPEYSIDSTVFGGMYANKITIVSTERGTGVRAPATMSSSAQGMTITADGRLVMGRATSQGRVSAQARTVVVRETVYSREPLSIEAKQELILEADGAIVSDAAANLTAGTNLRVETAGQIASRDALTLNVGETLALAERAQLMSYGDMKIGAGAADLDAGSLIYAGAADAGTTPATAKLDFTIAGDADLDSARLYATGNLTFDAQDITIGSSDATNEAQLVSLGELTVTARNATTAAARLEAAGNVRVALEQELKAGNGTVVAAGRQLALRSSEMMLVGTVLQSEGDIDVDAKTTINATNLTAVATGADGVTLAGNAVVLNGAIAATTGDATITARAGDLTLDGSAQAQGQLRVMASGAVATSGNVQGNGSVSIEGATITNSTGVLAGAAQIVSNVGDVVNTGAVSTSGTLSIASTQAITNSGAFQSGGNTALFASTTLTNTGALISNADLILRGLTVSNAAELTAIGALNLAATTDLTTSDTLQARGTLNLSAGQDLTTASTLLSNTGIALAAGADLTATGNYGTPGTLAATAAGVLNNSGTSATAGQATAGAIVLNGAQVINAGALTAVADLALTSALGTLENTAALAAGGKVALTAATSLTNDATLTATQTLALDARGGALTNSGVSQAQGALTLTSNADVVNAANLISNTSLSVTAGAALTNTGDFLTAGVASFVAATALTNSGNGLGGTEASAASLVLMGATVANTGNASIVGTTQATATTGALTNGGTILSGTTLTVDAAADLTNSGALRSSGDATLTAAAALSNVGVVESGAVLTMTGATLSNTGTIAAVGNTALRSTVGTLISSGSVASNSAVTLTSAQDLQNDGSLVAGGTLTLTAGNTLTNTGAVQSVEAMQFSAATIVNSGALTSNAAIGVEAVTNLTTSGTLQANGALALIAGGTLASTSDLISNAGITLTAARGLTSSGNYATSSDLMMTAGDALLTSGTSVTAGQAVATNITLTGATVTNNGNLASVEDTTFTALTGAVTNTGDLSVGRDLLLKGATDVINGGAILVGGVLKVETGTGTFANTGALTSQGDLILATASDFTNAGDLITNGDLTITSAGALTNDGGFLSGGAVMFTATDALINRGSGLSATGASGTALTFQGSSIENTGNVAVAGNLRMTSGQTTLINSGALLSGQELVLTSATALTNTGDLRANTRVDLNAATDLSNTGGLLSGGIMQLVGRGDVTNTGDGLGGAGADALSILIRGATVTNGGDLASAGQLQLDATTAGLVNSGALAAGGNLTLSGATTLTNSGVLQSAQVIKLEAVTINNTAALTSGGDLQMTAAGDLTTAGALQSGTIINLQAGRNLVSDSTFLAQDALRLTASGDLTTRGDFVTAGDVTMTATGTLNNAGGALLAGQAVGKLVTLTGGNVINAGTFTAADDVNLSAAAGRIDNTGNISSAGAIALNAATVNNAGVLASAKTLTLASTGALTNSGALSSQEVLNLSATGNLTTQGALIGATSLTVSSQGDLTNNGGFQSLGEVRMTAAGLLTNTGDGLATTGASATQLTLQANDVINSGSALIAGAINLTALTGALTNSGDLGSGDRITASAAGLLTNTGALTSAKQLVLNGAAINNGGALSSNNFVQMVAGTAGITNTADVHAVNGITFNGVTDVINSGDLRSNFSIGFTSGSGNVTNTGGILTGGRFEATVLRGGFTNSGNGLAATGASAQSYRVIARDITNSGDLKVQDTIQFTKLGSTGAVTQTGALQAGGNVTIAARNSQVDLGGSILTGGVLDVEATTLNSTGTITAQGAVTLETFLGGSMTQTGTLRANGDVTLTSALRLTQSGILQSAQGNVSLNAVNTATLGGQISSANDINVVTNRIESTGTLVANGSVLLQSDFGTIGGSVTGLDDVTITGRVGQTTALNGTVQSNGKIDVDVGVLTMGNAALLQSSAGDITLDAINSAATAGTLRTGANVVIESRRVRQAADIEAGLTATITATANNGVALVQSGTITSQAIAINSAEDISNTGTLNGAVGITAARDFSNAGTIAGAVLIVNARDITNAAAGVMNTTGNQQLVATRNLTNRGEMTASGTVIANAAGTLNNYGRIDAGGQLSMTVGSLNNRSGGRAEGATIVIAASNTVVNAGRLQSAGAFTLNAATRLTNTGNIQSGGNLGITTAALTNSGQIDAFGGYLILEGLGALDNRNGRLSSDTGIQIGVQTAVDFGSANWGTVQSDGFLRLQGVNNGYMSALSVGAGDEIVAQGALFIKARGITNNGTIASATGDLVLQSRGGITNTGVIYAGGNLLALRARDTITNSGGAILAANAMLVCGIATTDCLSDLANDRAAGLTNTSGGIIETFSGDIIIAADAVQNNTGGTVNIVNTGPTALPLVNNDPGGCSGFCFGNDSYRYTKIRETVSSSTVTLTGTPSKIISGGSITINANSVVNFYSLISATDHINFTAGSIENTAASTTNTSVVVTENWYFKDRRWPKSNRRYIESTVTADPVTTTDLSKSYFATIEAGGNITGVVSGPLVNGVVSDGLAALTAVGVSTPTVSANLQTASASGAQGFSGVTTPTAGTVGNTIATVLGQQSVNAGTANPGLSGVTVPNAVSGLTLSPRNFAAPTVGTVSTSTTTTTTGSNAALTATGINAPTIPGTSRKALRDIAPNLASGVAVSAGGNGVTDPSITDAAASLINAATGLPNAGTVGGNTNVNPERIIGVLDLSALGNDQLFAVNPGSDTNYLVETRFEFIDQGTFLSSDYFLEGLNLNPEEVQQRLGDPLAETYLIRDQIFNLIGRRILEPGLSEREQIRNMYNNAIDAARNLGLRPGVALTPQQIAALTEDIIWLEERIVSGQVVLVPQVYLARSAGIGGVFAPSTITATNISLEVDTLTNINGAITALDQLVIDGQGDIINQFGAITAGDLLQITTDGDVNNLSGVIRGGDVNIIADNILNETVVVRSELDALNFDEFAGVTAEITATTGQLNLEAVNNITVIGGDLSAVSGISILAGGDIDFAALQLDSGLNRDDQDGLLEEINSLAQVSNINVSEGGVNITSVQLDEEGLVIGGGNVLFEGTQIAAAGEVNVSAYSGSVILGAAIDSTYSDSFQEDGGFLSSSTFRQETLTVTAQTTDITGSAINIFGAGTVYDASSGFNTTDGDLTVRSGTGDVIFSSVTEIFAQNTYDQTVVLGGLMEFTTETQSLETTALETRAEIEGNIALIAGGDLEFQGGEFTATGTINSDVAGETRILATVDTDFEYVQDLNNNSLLVVDTTTVTNEQTADFTRFNAGEGVNLDPDSATTFGLVQEQAAVGPAVQALVGVQDVSDPTQDMAITEFFLPDSTGSPTGDDRINELTDNPLILALAGDQSGDAPTGDGAGGEVDPMFDFAGAMVDVGLPTSADGEGFAYIEDLQARDNVTVEDMQLVQFGYEDQQVSLGVVGQLALTYISGGIAGGLSAGLGITSAFGQAMVTSAVSGVLEGAITGNFDIGDILTDVAFAGVSSYASEAFNLDELVGLGDATSGSLIGAGSGQFSVNNIVDQLGDSVIGAGLTTAVYGGDFGDNFLSSFQSGVVSLATADVQNLIGDQFNQTDANGNSIGPGEGSVGHVLSHALAGCGSAVLSGGDCAAGAAAASVAAIGSGIIANSDMTFEERVEWADEIQLISGIGAALTGADSADVLAASGIGNSAFVNNYLDHEQRELAEDLLRQISECNSENRATCSLEDRAALLAQYEALKDLSVLQDQQMLNACASGPSEACSAHVTEAELYLAWQVDVNGSTLNAQVFGDENYVVTERLTTMFTQEDWINSSIQGNMGLRQGTLYTENGALNYNEWANENCNAAPAQCAVAFADLLGQQELNAALPVLIVGGAFIAAEALAAATIVEISTGIFVRCTAGGLCTQLVNAAVVTGTAMCAGEAIAGDPSCVGMGASMPMGSGALIDDVAASAAGLRGLVSSNGIAGLVDNIASPGLTLAPGSVADSVAIVPNATVRLNQNIVTASGDIIPAGSIVRETGGIFNVSLPNGQIVSGRTADLLNGGGSPLLTNNFQTSNPPESPDFPIFSSPAGQNQTGFMAVNPGQIDPVTGQVNRPGGFLSTDPITSTGQVRNDLAVRSDWKDDDLWVQEFVISPGTQIQQSTVGPQINPNGTVLQGGGNQIEVLVPPDPRPGDPIPTGPTRSDVLTPVGPAVPLP